ncbi:energy-coupling factor transporter ATPase [Caldalkalibacillus salinus]|uniref:energy-coupling factor transporter ATPase n=1 Tax=Caldalkalibacillus salinus TaxID=2803787 RepID=UPI0019209182|nr:energy-coupling factor transporter ATPase [Caldalkalibacillus salinus]
MIQCQNLTFAYGEKPGQTPVLNGINLSITKGEYVVIVGPNGSGKSTLLRLINRLLTPTTGEVIVDGQIGMVFQNPENQFVATTVLDDVAFGLENIGFPPDSMMERIEETLRMVGMWEFRDREPQQLSGGQKQRVAIAGVLAVKPDVILFDEATSMLDPSGKEELVQTMRDLHHKGMTLVSVTHDMNEALEADRVILIDQGQVIRDEAPNVFFTQHDDLEDYQLHRPFFYDLTNTLRAEGIQIPSTIQTERALVEYLWTYN